MKQPNLIIDSICMCFFFVYIYIAIFNIVMKLLGHHTNHTVYNNENCFVISSCFSLNFKLMLVNFLNIKNYLVVVTNDISINECSKYKKSTKTKVYKTCVHIIYSE
jgi:hypothetical protein